MTLVEAQILEPARPEPFGRPSGLDSGLLLVAVLAVSTSGPIVASLPLGGLTAAAWRCLLAAAVLLPVALVRCAAEVRRPHPKALLAGLLLAAHFATWLPALSLTSIASATALVTSQPIWAAVLARRRGHELSRGVWIGLAIALVGVATITGIDLTISRRALAGDLLSLLSSVFVALCIDTSAAARTRMSTVGYSAVAYSVAALAVTPLALLEGLQLDAYRPRTWVLIGLLTLVPQLLGHSLINHVVGSTSAGTVSLAILFEVPGAVLVAWAWLGQTPDLAALVGVGVLLIGIGIVIRCASGGD